MAGKDKSGNEFTEGIYVDVRSGEGYSFENELGDCYFGQAWLGSPLKKGIEGVLLSNGDALMKNFAPVFLKGESKRDFLEITESL